MSFDAASFPVARQRLPMRRRWLALGASACVLLFSSLALAAESAGKIIGILTFDGILTSEVTAPIEVFGKASKEKEFADYRVVTIAPERRPISTAEGLVMLPQYSIDDAPPLDVLIVGGADKMDQVLADPKLALFIRNQGRQVSWLASNCAGASLLGEAGLLAGRRATTYRGGEEAIRKKYGAAIVGTDERVVVDGNLVTSNGGLVSYRAALTLLERMTTGKFAKRIGEGLYYNLLVSAGAAVAGAPTGVDDGAVGIAFGTAPPPVRGNAFRLAENAAAGVIRQQGIGNHSPLPIAPQQPVHGLLGGIAGANQGGDGFSACSWVEDVLGRSGPAAGLAPKPDPAFLCDCRATPHP